MANVRAVGASVTDGDEAAGDEEEDEVHAHWISGTATASETAPMMATRRTALTAVPPKAIRPAHTPTASSAAMRPNAAGSRETGHAADRLDEVAAAAGAVVEIVSVDCADEAPGATVGGLNEQLASGGRLVHPSVTAPGKTPLCAETVT